MKFYPKGTSGRGKVVLEAKDILSPNHYTVRFYRQRMTTKHWKQILLEGKEEIYFQGQPVKLTAKSLGAGVVEVSKGYKSEGPE